MLNVDLYGDVPSTGGLTGAGHPALAKLSYWQGKHGQEQESWLND